MWIDMTQASIHVEREFHFYLFRDLGGKTERPNNVIMNPEPSPKPKPCFGTET